MTPRPLRVMSIVGARPNFMKVAPLAAELTRHPGLFESILVHTGQHYDEKLSRVFFDELGLPKPHVNLEVGSGSHAQQTAAIMAAFEPVLLAHRPDVLVVVGDVNSTVACALVAAKLDVPVAHVEAGLRSFDRRMPEEINRLLTDQLSDLLLTSEPSGRDNLIREGIAPEKIHFVGNLMIDTLLKHRETARTRHVPARFDLTARGYGLLTLHRPSNVDDPETFDRIVQALEVITNDVPFMFPVHPRTRPTITRSVRAEALVRANRLRLIDPLGYIEFLGLMEGSRVVLTDSGGVQEETTILGVPCLTLRDNTERPVTISHGTNQLVGNEPKRILTAWASYSARPASDGAPPLWDGRSAGRVVEALQTLRSRTGHEAVQALA